MTNNDEILLPEVEDLINNQAICDAQLRAFKQTWNQALDLIGGSNDESS